MMSDEQRTGDDVIDSPGVGGTWRSGTDSAPQDTAVGDSGRAGTGKARDEGRASRPRSGLSVLSEMVILIAVALTVALLIKTFVVQPFFIPSGSMENTLMIGDKILVNKLVYDIRPIGRGDIVVFNGAGSWNAPVATPPASRDPVARVYDDTLGKFFTAVADLFGTPLGQTDYVKRVIGLPGDHVRCCDAQGNITVNGVALHEQSYLIPGATPSLGSFDVVVPPGRLFVLGDNRPESSDSRLNMCGYTEPGGQVGACLPWDPTGTIPENKVIGRVFMIVWPPSRWQIIRVPATFGQPALLRSGTALAGAALAAAPALPLAAGIAVAVPLSLLRWRVRRRRPGRRVRRGRGAQAG